MPEEPVDWQQLVNNIMAAITQSQSGTAEQPPQPPTPAPVPEVKPPAKPAEPVESEEEKQLRYARHGLDPEQLKFFQELATLRKGQLFSQQAFMDALQKGQFGPEGEDLLAGLPSKRELM